MSKVANPFAYMDAVDKYFNSGNNAKVAEVQIKNLTTKLLDCKNCTEVDKIVSQIQRKLYHLSHSMKQRIQAEQELEAMKEEQDV